MKHIMAILDMFESNNNILNQTEDILFLTIYGILCCFAGMWGGTVGSDVTLCQNGSVFIRCRTMAVGAALAL